MGVWNQEARQSPSISGPAKIQKIPALFSPNAQYKQDLLRNGGGGARKSAIRGMRA